MNAKQTPKTPPEKPSQKREDRTKLLEHVENHTSKSDFVGWLNNQHGGAYSENADWADIKEAVLKSNISGGELHSYAASLSSDADVKKLLKDVEQQTSEAQVVADKLSLLSTLKKFAVATGGACLLSGVLLLAVAASFWLGVMELEAVEGLYVVSISLLVGLLQLLAGILLVTE